LLRCLLVETETEPREEVRGVEGARRPEDRGRGGNRQPYHCVAEKCGLWHWLVSQLKPFFLEN